MPWEMHEKCTVSKAGKSNDAFTLDITVKKYFHILYLI